MKTPPVFRFIRWFRELGISDVPLVGGKTASLGEMLRSLSPLGVRVPDGFAITADAYRRFLAASGLDRRIEERLAGLDVTDLEDLAQRGEALRAMILEADWPGDLAAEILNAYGRLGGAQGIDVAVRSSATAEDLPEASFAGQQQSFLRVAGEAALLDACKRCFASLFTNRAISYRADKGFDASRVALSVAVQRMVRSDLATSGVMFTLDTETGFRDVVLIEAAYGLGENVVQGAVVPDECLVFKPTLAMGFRPILRKATGAKEFKLVYDSTAGAVRNVEVPPDERARFCVEDGDLLELARWACLIERHYSERQGRAVPMDIEWAKDGLSGELFIVQARPETVRSREVGAVIETWRLQESGPLLVSGRGVGRKIASGPVRVIADAADIARFQAGEVLVTDKTDPDWEPIMKKAAAIVTDRGGRTCHAAIVSRELGVPAVVGTGDGRARLRDGQVVTVSCAEGEVGRVYGGRLAFGVERTEPGDLVRPITRVMMNVADPAEALRLSFIPNDGVGLAREEFIISNSIGIHPLALLDYPNVEDPVAKVEMERLSAGYADKPGYFVDKLAQGVAMLAAAFYPKDVILRLSDFKTNEYANLVGGKAYEPLEENPMLGFRGASRYGHPRYRRGFALECRAVRKVREEMGLVNLKLMIPFCRTPEEARRVLAEMSDLGLRRGEKGLEVHMMCEIPSNVMLAEEFCELFDGFSIGSNDLTQLVLGVDRDSEVVAPIFDERNEAVLRMISRVIRVCRSRGRKIGICGQAPSDYPEFARFLVREGIDSISLDPDSVMATTLAIIDEERAV
ncbi:MAG: phosphoenolpyruvate synthase [Verrucomicrobia bacterium]|nr:MAG: phosphoenolpyruvate synthase [Verrucomicrobiota bacterium]TAE87505.1 MAG: phosphoenolpyruvate synthase [Verrucomicrobiota bacterium]TAF25786.1 MAG: phosphoenolpyruvate synthase [Verrucomicrobiota bacterium]TAF41574.1 MAG: phosphoenolpyruvate synthase [Verrucomicrobiota bacterium]